jgi:membrane peptidoglycan carboxypeptidase
MPSVPQILSMRQRRQRLSQRSPNHPLGLGCSTIFSLALVLLAAFLAIAYADLIRNLPPPEQLAELLEPPDGLLLHPTKFFDRNGSHIMTIENRAALGRQWLKYVEPGSSQTENALSNAVIQATLAASDPDFWVHPGFSIPGLHRARRPSLAMRLVDELLLAGEPDDLRRQLRQRFLAAQITARYGRGKVLEWYLNSADYGYLAFGVDAAARLYFNKPASQLSLAEAAMLAAIAEDPNLNPFAVPQEALARQKRVIQEALAYRLISPQDGMTAARQELDLAPVQPLQFSFDAIGLSQQPAFYNLVMQQLETTIPRRRLLRGGLQITVSLDADLQNQAACLWLVQQSRLSEAESSTTLPDCPAAEFLTSSADESMIASPLNANLVVLDPRSGQILALVGAPVLDLAGSPLPAHPAGTLSLPFIYLTAFTRGLSPASLVWDIPGQTPGALQNFDGQYHGPVRLRIALANDYLSPAQSVLELVGVANAWRTAQQMGILSPDAPVPSISSNVLDLLGEIDLLSASQAFGALANEGIVAGRMARPDPKPVLKPSSVLRVEDAAGNVWLDWSAWQTQPLLTPQLAYLLTHILSDESARWPSLGQSNPLETGRPTAAKLGLSPGQGAWGLGYIPQRVVGVWLGPAQGAALQAGDSEALPFAAANLWGAMMKYVMRDLPVENWEMPPGVSVMKVCDPSGMLPTSDCPNVVEEIFAAGSEPVQTDRLYQAIPVNRQTGRLATIFTPPELVERRVYFILPSEAQSWAASERYSLPPEVYDSIPLELPAWPEAVIDSPAMFAVVRGQVTIRGRAGSQNFSFFGLQAGAGLNPQRWLQIGAQQNSPVTEGVLGVWDTNGLDGLYAIQLLVVQSDQSLKRAAVLVTVDNRPPLVEIAFPTPGARLPASQSRLLFQINAQDNIGLRRVSVYVNDRLLNEFTQPPFAASWSVTPGQHTLRVVAVDLAGNSHESSVTFSVEE